MDKNDIIFLLSLTAVMLYVIHITNVYGIGRAREIVIGICFIVVGVTVALLVAYGHYSYTKRR